MEPSGALPARNRSTVLFAILAIALLFIGIGAGYYVGRPATASLPGPVDGLARTSAVPRVDGGVAVHVDVVRAAVRDHGGQCTVLDIGKGQLPAEGVLPAGNYAGFARTLLAHAWRGYLMHVHTSGANPKSWALAAACAAAAMAKPCLPDERLAI